MESSDKLQTYHTVYNLIRDNTRYKVNFIAKHLGLSGIGRTKSTASKYINEMYNKKISLRPNLILKGYENCTTKAYFLKTKNRQDLTTAYLNLMKRSDISYLLFLSGIYDFFVTSRYNLSFDKSLSVKESTLMYDPIYTNPLNWNREIKKSFSKIANSSLVKGNLEREIGDFLPWNEVHFNIFDTMKNNAQMPFSHVKRKIKISQTTIKKYFLNDILPYCDIAHYFFPDGYDTYLQSMIILKTDYEKGLVDQLYKLPCTTYVYPLENKLVLIIFHKGINHVMYTFKKFEEKGFVRESLLLIPLHWE